MKIGILTFQFADNYGAVLQAYSLKKSLEADGINDVNIINYVNDGFKNAYSINPFKKKNNNPKTFIKSCLLYPQKLNQAKKFMDFRRKELGIFEKETDTIKYSDYDIIVVGSDQVWNLGITFNDMNYFLPRTDKNDKCVRVSYAASADDGFLSEAVADKLERFLFGFKAISVREEQLGIKLSNLFRLQSTLVCDPVFLQDKGFWTEFGILPKELPDRYVLVYSLKGNQHIEDTARKLSEEKKIPVIVMHPQARRICAFGELKRDIGPKEFVGLINNAEYIVSNSFHAFAFSLIFSKKIIFDCLIGASNRIISLVDVLDINVENLGDGLRYAELQAYGNEKFNDYLDISLNFITQNIMSEERSDVN